MKKKPTYNLKRIQRVFSEIDGLRMTTSAMCSQVELDFSDQDIVDAIQSLTDKDFYKSMSPVRPGFTAWQDVYKSSFKGKKLYIKFQINNNKELIVSFKESTAR